jgi:hypothetical protein
VSVLERVGDLASGDLRAQLTWLHDASQALENEDLGEGGARAALDLKAALGAVVVWSQGPQDPSTLVELQAVVRTLTTRGLVSLYQALSSTWADLASRKGPRGSDPNRLAAHQLADAYRTLAVRVGRGEPVPTDVVTTLRELRATVDRAR